MRTTTMLRYLFGLLVACLLGTAAYAAVTATPVFVQTPTLGLVQFLQGVDPPLTYKTLYTAGSNGSRCSGMTLSTIDTGSAHVVTVAVVRGGTTYALTNVSVAIATSGMPPIPMMSTGNWPGLPLDASGNPYIQLVSGDVLKVTFATALTTGSSTINVAVVCGDF